MDMLFLLMMMKDEIHRDKSKTKKKHIACCNRKLIKEIEKVLYNWSSRFLQQGFDERKTEVRRRYNRG